MGKYTLNSINGLPVYTFVMCVGILPNGEVLFTMSKQEINFYDFATFFKNNVVKR